MGAVALFAKGTLRIHAYPLSASTGVPEPTPIGGGKGGYNCASADNNNQSRLDASTYCTGYCTWWVWQKRPEQQLKNLGEAYQWFGSAQAKGIPVGHTPVVGAVAWWNAVPGTPDADGHVAFVTAVNGNSITISEMNHEGWDVSDTRTLPADGRLPDGYIYGGPAGDGSTSGAGATPPAPPHVTGDHYVYYIGSDGGIDIWFWNGSSWANQDFGGTASPNSSPSAYTGPDGNHYVYYVGSDGGIHIWFWNGSQWQNQNLGGSVESGTSPAAYIGANGNHYVYYVGSDGGIHIWFWNGSQWLNQNLGGSVESGTRPSGYTN